MKYEDDIHNCTNERLAEMLEFTLPRLESPTERKVIAEAATRLRNMQRTLKSKVPFNNEQFE